VELALVQSGVEAIGGEELCVGAGLHDPPVLEDQDPVGRRMSRVS